MEWSSMYSAYLYSCIYIIVIVFHIISHHIILSSWHIASWHIIVLHHDISCLVPSCEIISALWYRIALTITSTSRIHITIHAACVKCCCMRLHYIASKHSIVTIFPKVMLQLLYCLDHVPWWYLYRHHTNSPTSPRPFNLKTQMMIKMAFALQIKGSCEYWLMTYTIAARQHNWPNDMDAREC